MLLLKMMPALLLSCLLMQACSAEQADENDASDATPSDRPTLSLPANKNLNPNDPNAYGFRVMPVHRGTFSLDRSVGYFNDVKVPTGMVLGTFMPFAQLFLPKDAKLPELQVIDDPNSAWECQFRFKGTKPVVAEDLAAYTVDILVAVKRDSNTAVCRVKADIAGQTYNGTLQRRIEAE